MQEIILILSVASDPVTFLYGLFVRRSFARELNILLLYVGFSSLSDFLLMFLGTHHIQNIWVTYGYTPVQYAALAMIFSFWQANARMRKLVLASIPFIFLLTFSTLLFGEGFSHFNSYSSSLSGLFILLIAVFSLFKLNLEARESITRLPAFWVCLGAIVYFGATLFLSCMENAVFALPNDLGKSAFIINAISSMLANCLYFIAFSCSAKTPKFSGR